MLIDGLKENPYFSAGFGLVGIGTGIALLRKSAGYGYIYLKKHFTSSLEVSSKDTSYDWLMLLLASKSRGLGSYSNQHVSVKTTIEQLENGQIVSSFNYHPSPGIHMLFHNKKWIRFERQRDNRLIDQNKSQPFETVTLTILSRSMDFFQILLEQAKKEAQSKSEGRISTFVVGPGSEWRLFGFPRRLRPLNSVILDDQVSERLYADIKEFLQSPKWYLERGIPYRRGYLFHGPPGCGKSSLISALAGEFHHSLCVINIGERSLTDDRLHHLMNTAPQRSFIVLEDVDAAYMDQRRKDNSNNEIYYNNMLTRSGLLNAIDGIASSEERIVFMTTNHVERLDPALIRPGRIDVSQELTFCTKSQCQRLFQRFFPTQPFSSCLDFADRVDFLNRNFSPAHIQSYLFRYKNSPSGAIESVDELSMNITVNQQNDFKPSK